MKKKIQIIFSLYILFFSFNFINLSAEQTTPKTLQYFIENQEKIAYVEDTIIITLKEKNDSYLKYLEITYHFNIKHLYQNTYIANFDSTQFTMKHIMTKIHKYSEIKYAEPNYYFQHVALPTTEPLYNQQWAYTNQLYGINILDVWSETLGSADVVVAVLDSGLVINHPDLANNIWINSGEINNDGLDNDGNGYIDDYMGWNFFSNNNNPIDNFGHGTFVSGIIAAEVNDVGITGTAPNTKIMNLRITNDIGEATLSSILDAINYALEKDVKIFNFSFVSTSYNSTLEDLMRNADAIFVCGAGNDTNNNDNIPYYPASFNIDNVISVSSTDDEGELAWFSNYGVNSVHLAAPGDFILSTYLAPTYHEYWAGTSFSTPFVTATIALIHGEYPELTILELKEAILETTTTLPSLDGLLITGGILNAHAAFTYFDPIIGDLNGDKKVTISDLIILRRHLAGIELIDEELYINADLNDDGFVTISDLIKLRRSLAGLEEL